MSVKLVGRRKPPKDSDEIKCDTHNVVTTWGELDHIQRLAVENGLDTLEDLPCLLLPRFRGGPRAPTLSAAELADPDTPPPGMDQSTYDKFYKAGG
jgi:hypothetical protein